MSNIRVQPISGVSAGVENVVMVVFPSISALGLGRLLGRLCESIPFRVNGIKISHLLFALPISPIAAVLYLMQKVIGNKYVVTNRSLQIWKAMFNRLVSSAALSDIGDVEVVELPGQSFYKAAELVVLGKNGEVLMRLGGVPRAEVFRHNVLETCAARTENDAALATIRPRQTA